MIIKNVVKLGLGVLIIIGIVAGFFLAWFVVLTLLWNNITPLFGVNVYLTFWQMVKTIILFQLLVWIIKGSITIANNTPNYLDNLRRRKGF